MIFLCVLLLRNEVYVFQSDWPHVHINFPLAHHRLHLEISIVVVKRQTMFRTELHQCFDTFSRTLFVSDRDRIDDILLRTWLTMPAWAVAGMDSVLITRKADQLAEPCDLRAVSAVECPIPPTCPECQPWLRECHTQFCMNGDALAGIIADAPIKMPPDEDAGHPGSVVASFTAQPTADPPAFSQTATAPKSTQPAQQQVQPPVQQSHAPAPEPPKTLDEYLRVMTIEQAKAVKVDFGRFSGWSLGEIAMKSPGDLAWYVKNYSGHNLALKAGATKLLETVGQMAS